MKLHKKLCTILVIWGSVLLANAVETVDVITTFKDGSTKTKTLSLTTNTNAEKRLRISKDDISPNVKYIDIHADTATAKKGDDGYFIFERGEYGTFKLDNGSFIIDIGRSALPIYCMKTNRDSFMAIIKGLRLEYEIRAEINNGIYKIFPRFRIDQIGFKPYEDIIIDFIEFKGKDANYSAMARYYRNWIFSQGKMKPLKERVKNNKVLSRVADKILVRFDHCGSKKPPSRSTPDVLPENEAKLNVYLPFSEISKIVKETKSLGLNDIYFELTGWQAGGYDGRLPSIYPIPEEFGGEVGLRNLVAEVEGLDYPITMQSNHTQILRVSDMWCEDYIARNIDGSRSKDIFFLAGQQYNLCIKHTWNIFVKQQITERKARFGFKSGYYTDVYSAVSPYLCTNPAHPSSRAETVEAILESTKYSQSLYGIQGSECGFDFCLQYLDFIHYVSNMDAELINRKKYKGNIVMDGIFPMWEIVYHGTILHTSGRKTQNHGKINDPYWELKRAEFCDRPIFYGLNKKRIPLIKTLLDSYAKYRHLQFETMDNHQLIAKDVFEITYSNGDVMVCNYTDNNFNYKGNIVKPISFEVIRKK